MCSKEASHARRLRASVCRSCCVQTTRAFLTAVLLRPLLSSCCRTITTAAGLAREGCHRQHFRAGATQRRSRPRARRKSPRRLQAGVAANPAMNQRRRSPQRSSLCCARSGSDRGEYWKRSMVGQQAASSIGPASCLRELGDRRRQHRGFSTSAQWWRLMVAPEATPGGGWQQ